MEVSRSVQKITAQKTLMASPFILQAYVETKQIDFTRNAFQLAFAEIERIENLMTEFRSSPVAEINAAAGKKPIKVPRELIDVLEYSLRLSRDSDGAFDVTHAALGDLWRRAAACGKWPSAEEIEQAKALVDYRLMEIDGEAKEVFLPRAGMRIGLGGIGKGYAVDRVFHFLQKQGLENFMVSGAGDIRVSSSEFAPRPWRVAIRNPFSADYLPIAALHLSSGAIATSGDYERSFRVGGKTVHHVINPKTGYATEDLASVSIISESALLSDVLATTAMTLGIKRGIEFLNRRARVSGYLVGTDGKVITTSNWQSGTYLGIEHG